MTRTEQAQLDVGRFPALQRLGAFRRRAIPYVPQMESADCGAACLAMVLSLHGRVTRLEEARVAAGSSRGTDALALVRAGEQFGLRGRGVRLETGDLRHLPTGAILHWDFNHFVVLERVRRQTIEIVDPARGRRRITLDRVKRHFTGVALIFEPRDDFVPAQADQGRIAGYLSRLREHRGVLARVLTISVVVRLVALSLPLLTAMVVDRVIPRDDYGLLLVVGLGALGMLCFQIVSALVRSHLLIQLRTDLDTRMTLGFVGHLLALPYSFFNKRSAGDLVLRVSSNAQIRDILTSGFLSTLLDGGLAVLYLVLLLAVNSTMALVTLVAGALQVVVLLLFRRHYAALMSQDLDTQAKANSYLVQMLVGIETLKACGAEDRALERWSHLYVDQLNVSLKRSRLSAVLDAANGFLQAAAPLALLGLGATLVMKNELSLGTMLATTALAAAFLVPLANLLSSVLQLQMLGSYVARIEDVVAQRPERRSQDASPVKLTGAIELQRVSFRYGPSEPMVLNDISLAVPPHTSLAIVGRSGSGKSTLAALLLGLHLPTEGRILYDSTDMADVDPRSLRCQMGMVPQNPFIFSGSIRENIALADRAVSLERVVTAARKACIDDDIRAMPMGYETIVADGGASLSGGQRQRIALARALLHAPAVLVLDEATSSLDASTEKEVVHNLAGLRTTRIVIAHRLSTILAADKIVVLENGRITEIGTHDDLVARNGAYAALVADQTFGEGGRM